MPDREKVIKALEYCALSNDCRPCEYWMEFDDTGCQIMKDALALLKEKEAVEPCKDIARNRRCPNCYAILKGKFCHECGQAVKWD